MARDVRGPAPAGQRPAIQKAALLVAAVFVLIGVLGFIPGVTEHSGDLAFAGHHSQAKLFYLFQVSILHNLIHLVFGLVGLVLARRVGGARLFLAGGGAVYLVIWLYGFGVDRESSANFVPFNDADNWLHLFLGFGMLLLGLLLSPRAGTGGRLDTPLDRP
ncbi:DUF4383 domain-containing protein [Micromonospora sp. CB01531]|uniref:DUF4383 domain-containing protein n=1 Tax=Micromonospora sp. CB01531 TaxID=1718947 RepID=UPI00093E7DC8|nr:DUF4383 domain-containing protein [Micromonospora sp. CB01531]OKI49905.1 hypothetical protein A6A27_34785 [Micromonospora sp. CB01531]